MTLDQNNNNCSCAIAQENQFRSVSHHGTGSDCDSSFAKTNLSKVTLDRNNNPFCAAVQNNQPRSVSDHGTVADHGTASDHGTVSDGTAAQYKTASFSAATKAASDIFSAGYSGFATMPMRLYHAIMGHRNVKVLAGDVENGYVLGVKLTSHKLKCKCSTCVSSKMKRGSHPPTDPNSVRNFGQGASSI